MHHGDLGRGRGRGRPEAANGGPYDRLRVDLVGLDHAGPVVQFAPPALGRIRPRRGLVDRQAFDRLTRDPAHGGEELRSDRRGVLSIGIDGERAGWRAPVDAPHDEEGAVEFGALDFEDERFRRRDALVREGANGEKL